MGVGIIVLPLVSPGCMTDLYQNHRRDKDTPIEQRCGQSTTPSVVGLSGIYGWLPYLFTSSPSGYIQVIGSVSIGSDDAEVLQHVLSRGGAQDAALCDWLGTDVILWSPSPAAS